MGFKQLFPEKNPKFNSSEAFYLYTDGSCMRNGQQNSGCGWAYICIDLGNEKNNVRSSGGCKGGTNNQMEMTAVLRGLQYLEKISIERPVTVYSDSKYVIDTVNGYFSIHKNIELWDVLLKQIGKFKQIQFIWVKGHADNVYNKLADQLANLEAQKYERM